MLPLDLPVLQRAVDFAATVEMSDGRRFLLHVECERGTDADMTGRMLEYDVALHRREGLPVVSVVLRMEGSGPGRGAEEYRMAVGGFEALVYRYRVLNLSALDARELLSEAHPVLWALVPLARDGARPEIVTETVERIRACAASDEARADLLAAMTIFAGVWGSRDLLYALVRRYEMKDSVIYKDIFLEGKAEGQAQGKAEGQAQGKAQGKVEDVLLVLEQRFGAVPEPIQARVGVIASTEQLDRLLRLALVAVTLDDFTTRM